MSTFISDKTGVVFTVDDSKDDRYGKGHKPYPEPAKRPVKKSAPSKSSK